MKLNHIDKGNDFDFGRTSDNYAKFRDIYPASMYQKIISFGIGQRGQKTLDLGSGTAVLPINLSQTGAVFTATDISKNQIEYGKSLVKSKGISNIDFKVCSAEDTGFENNSFDVVTAVQCFHYFDADTTPIGTVKALTNLNIAIQAGQKANLTSTPSIPTMPFLNSPKRIGSAEF